MENGYVQVGQIPRCLLRREVIVIVLQHIQLYTDLIKKT